MEFKTALYDCHISSGGKIVSFAGYLLPIQYAGGIIKEHLAVREKAGLFDVSHMGEVIFEGEDALANINYLFTNDFSDMVDGQARYSLLLNENGTAVDDLIVYKLNDQKYMVVVNAANREKDVDFIQSYLFGKVQFTDSSDSIAQIALQGPNALTILKKIADENMIPAKYYHFIEHANLKGMDCLISKTGYTGENGFEIYLSNEDAPKLWNILLEIGKEDGLIPCGLGARDTLRLEAAMPLYGHELSDEITPFEAGLQFAVKMQKKNFIGKSALMEKITPSKKRVCLKITGRGVVREHQPIFMGEMQIGESTSGTHSPYLNYPIAMALIDSAYAQIGTNVEAEVRGRRISAQVVPCPFYKRKI